MTDYKAISDYTDFNFTLPIVRSPMNSSLYRQSLERTISRVFFGLVLLSITAFYLPVAEGSEKADQIEILVIGSGKVAGGNTAAARKEAISQALVKGVEEYLTRRLGSQGMTNNFSRLINEVIPAAGEEIENFHILAEEKDSKRYKILLRIKVNEKLMQKKLREMGILLVEGPPVKLLFLVSEEKTEGGNSPYWWRDPETNSLLTTTELALHRLFQERGFSPVNRLLSVPEDKLSPDMRKLDLSDEEAIDWGRLFSSDLVILGKSEVLENKMVAISLKAIDVVKNSVIGQDHQVEIITGKITGTDPVIEAIERATNDIVVRLSPEIMRYLKENEDIVNTLKVELRGLKSIEQLRIFREFLSRDVGGVKSVVQTRIKGNSITVSIEFTGKKDVFFDKLMGNDKFPFLADITKTGEGEAVVEIK